nr:hypothetical protein [uncultured Flavobacterium sp.]
MKVYHQTGFRYNWNIESFEKGIGDGLIFSPINIDSDKLVSFKENIKKTSFLDPQLYLLNEAKSTLDTYSYFPGNLKADYSTPDLDNTHNELAKLCLDFQIENNFDYLVIPNRYYTDNPTNYFIDSTDFFIEPFCEYIKEIKNSKKILLSVIVKTIMLTDEERSNEVLNWITSHQKIDGVYVIFENNFTSKQIKDFDYLLNVLKFINILKMNQLEVHIGYCNTEALLYSIAMPDSITIGSYENLRSFGIKRFQNLENAPMRGPNARLYSSQLLQWVDYVYIQAMEKLIANYDKFFDESEFKPLMFNPSFKWHFAKAEPYKHYFYVFNNQIKQLPELQNDRIRYVKEKIKSAINLFNIIENDVLLDNDSNGSHLSTWFNVINSFEKEI